MNQDNLNFTSATQLYNLRLHKQTNDSLDSNITFDEEVDINDNVDLNNNSDDDEIRFVAPSQSDIDHTINYTNTNLMGDITQIKDCSELETILVNFFVLLRKKDRYFYAPTSIHNCYCGISRHLQMNSCQNPKPNILDNNQFSRLYSTIDGKIKLVQDTNPQQANKSDSLTYDEITQILNNKHLLEDTPTSITYRVYFWLCLLGGLRDGDAKRLKFNHIKVDADKNLKINILCEKNHAGGLKILNNSGRVCQIPPDMDDKFAP
ncbi:10988_t:CDS:2, partial [Gigaspora margarita]